MTDRERGRQAGKLERWTEIKMGGGPTSWGGKWGRETRGAGEEISQKMGRGGETREEREDCRRDCTVAMPFPQNAKCDELQSLRREQTEQSPHSFVKWPR